MKSFECKYDALKNFKWKKEENKKQNQWYQALIFLHFLELSIFHICKFKTPLI